MAYLHVLWIYSLISACAADTSRSMDGHVYNQMSYNALGSSLAHLVMKNKLLCAAQCALESNTCNTAVFNSSATPQCLLLSEVVIPANLVVAINSVVYDFQQSKFGATTSTTITTTTTGPLPFYGVQLNLDPFSLPSGWSLCYTATYATPMNSSLISTILTSCSQNKLLLGCRPVNNTIMTVAAMGNRMDVLYNCSSTINCTYVVNGVGWYFSDSWSWGFANGNDTVNRNECDISSTNKSYSLCWHTNANGGYQCGAKLGLNTDISWEKVIYQAT